MRYNVLVWVLALMLLVSMPLVSAAKTTIWNPFGNHLQFYNDAAGGGVINESTTVTGNLDMQSFNVTNMSAIIVDNGDFIIDMLDDTHRFLVREGATEIMDFNEVDNFIESVSIIPFSNGGGSLGTGSFAWSNLYVSNGISTASGNDLSILPASGRITKIGDAGSTSHSLAANDDLFVSGQLEVDGTFFPDAEVRIASDQTLSFGSSANAYGGIDIDRTNDQLLFGVGSEFSNNILFINWNNHTANFGHPVSVNPTVFIQSGKDPVVDNTQWGSLAHNQKDFVVDVGNISSKILAQNNFTSHNTFNAEADAVIGDQINQDLFSIQANGTAIVVASLKSSLPVQVLTYNSTGGRGKCFMNDTWDWQCAEI